MAEGEKKIPIAIIMVLIVVGLVLAGGISYFIATKIVADQTGAKSNAAQRSQGVLMKIGDPKEGLIVNIGGVNSGRYLKINIILEVKPDKKQQELAGKTQSPEEVKMLDTIIYALRSLKVEEYDPVKQDRLKEIIKQEINKALGEERVLDVYITNLVVQ